jgi:hypothetical protein
MVAGRTASQIERAKRKAVGGKRKRCVKGKSCSATCIAANKVCMVDIPWAAAKGIPKVVAQIQGKQAPKVDKTPTNKPAVIPPAVVKPAPKPAPEPAKVGSGKGFNLAKGEAPKLPKLTTIADINSALYSPDSSLKVHEKIRDLMKGNDVANSFARNYLTKLVGGAAALQKALAALRTFTGSTYTEMREAQRRAKRGETLSSYYKEKLERAKDLEKLVAKLPKEPVIKYRGIRVERAHLQGMIAMANKKGTFTEGALSSWSTGLETPLSFAGNTDYLKTESVILRTVNRRGAAVKHLSAFFNEDEVLTSGTAKYKYVGNYNTIVYAGKTYHVFDLVES